MEPSPPLAWEELVTQGHVLAARLRRRQPLLIGVAGGMMRAGWLRWGPAKRAETRNDRARVLAAEVQQIQWRAVHAFAGLPPPRIGRSELAALPPASGLGEVQQRLLEGLNADGKVAAELNFRQVEPRDFWRTAWKPGETITASDGSVRIVGRLTNSGTSDFPRAARWLGVFREQDGEWTSVSVQGTDFVGIPGTPSVAVETIPVTLAPLLQTEE
jgi:hypothetical protein